MQVYKYQALTESGQTLAGEIAAEDTTAVAQVLARQGLTLIELSERRIRRLQLGRGHARPELVAEFTRSLASLLSAGIPLLQALDDLEAQAENRGWKEMLHDMRIRIEGGSTVSEAIAAHPQVFDDLFVSLVRAGEESGQIEQVLEKLAQFLEWTKGIRDDLRRALSYPSMVLGALFGFTGLLTFFVFPRLGGLFESLEVDLPLPTRVMLALGHFGESTWPFLVGAIVVLIVGFSRLRATKTGRRTLDALSLRIPLIGPVLRMAAYSRFSNTLATLIDAGVPLDRALGLVSQAVGNLVIGDAILECRSRIEGGEPFSESLGRTGHFPRLVLRMVKVGETGGDLPGMLHRLTEYYEREMPYRVRKLLSAIGPITVFALAGTVAFAALSVFMPLLRISSAIH